MCSEGALRAGARGESLYSLCQQKMQCLIRERVESRKRGGHTEPSLPSSSTFQVPFQVSFRPHPHLGSGRSTTVVEFHHRESLGQTPCENEAHGSRSSISLASMRTRVRFPIPTSKKPTWSCVLKI